MIGKDDLGLSLSLNCRANDEEEEIRRHSLQLNLLPPSLSSSSSSSQFMNHRWTEPLTSVADRNLETYRGGEMRSLLRGIDVNRIPQTTTTIDCEEEAGVSSPKSTVSSVSGKRSEREANCGEDNDIERASSRGMSDDEDGDTSRKKLRLSKDQSAILEESFKEHNTLNPKQKLALAKRLNLRPRQVEVWFQNRRARTKLKQTEVDCEFLKRCCENLTEENRRLQKEVQELRALKLSPQFYMHMTPPTTLTMCPSCERVAVSATNNTSVASVVSTSVGAAEVHHTHLMGAHNHNHNHCALSINPWATTPVNHHRQFDAVHPRS